MTEDEWMACADPGPMLEFLKGKASDRKLRLFACACCRRVWFRWGATTAPEPVVVSEQFADGEVRRKQLQKVLSQLGAMGGVSAAWAANCAEFAVLENDADIAAVKAVSSALYFAHYHAYEETFSRTTFTGDEVKATEARDVERKELAAMLPEIFANPFRPSTFHHAWKNPIVVNLAQTIYAARAFDRLPNLADALEQAGCDNSEILAHCRGCGPHVRGCWVVDLVLGKE